MRLVPVVATLAALTACRPAAHVAIGDKGVPVITAAPGASFKDVREALGDVAATHPRAFLHLEASPDEDLVELTADDNDDLDVLVVVRVTKYDTVVGGQATRTEDEIKTVSSNGIAGASRFAVVRAEDDARVVDVLRATRAVGGVFSHTILSRRAPSTRTITRTRGDAPASITCQWPQRGPRAPVAAAKVLVEVTRDQTVGVGRVKVLNAPPGGFRQAAAFCASTAELPSSVTGDVVPLEVEFEVGNHFQCTDPGDDRMARGAYTPSEVHSTYGTLPSQGCDRFPR